MKSSVGVRIGLVSWFKQSTTVSLLGLLAAVVTAVAGQGAKSGFAERLANPPAEARIIKIIHGWPDEPARQDDLIRRLSRQGFGGVVCNVSFADYLESKTKWEAFTRAVQHAKEAGFALWLYDEKGYPSGEAGGLVLRAQPESEARGLLVAETEGAGGTLTLKLPPGRPVLTAAYPVRDGKISLKDARDLSTSVREQSLSWTAPEGRWRVLAMTEDRLFDGTHASMSLSDHIPYPNLLMAEPTAKFLELTHDRYAAHLGRDLGKYFVATFTDEPSLMSLFLRRMPYAVLPWSPQLAAEFKARRGYALQPRLAALATDAGPDSARVRYDFWKTVGELVSENYFGQIQNWCGKHGLLSGGHPLMEENPANDVALYGDFFQCLRRLDAPSIDCLTSIPDQVPWFIGQLAASAAELENKTVVMCETSDHSQRYRPAGDTRPVQPVSEAEIRGTCNRLIRSGVNAITSYYSFADLTDDQLRRINEWVGRCCAAVSGGHQAAEIAVVYPVESLWPRFTPSRLLANDCPGAVQLEQLFRRVSDALYAAGRDFTYVDSRALAEARVEGGTLVHGKLRWRVVVLPGVDTLPWKAWEKLERFVAAGGVLIAFGNMPANSESEFPSPAVQRLGGRIFGKGDAGVHGLSNRKGGGSLFLPAGWTKGLAVTLDRALPRDLTAAGSDSNRPSPVRYTHRRIDGREVYFVINDSAAPWRGKLSFATEGAGERWDLATGKEEAVLAGHDVEVELPEYGAAVFTFAKARKTQPIGLAAAGVPRFARRELLSTSPEIARGEFVREQMEPMARGGKPGFRIRGTLTKSQVDTYLFARFFPKQPLDLREADALVFDTSVPEGQRMTGQLLVILHEKGGADYLANTGRLLSAPGTEECWVSPENFQLAGWSTDANGRLDLEEITEVRIGWGGYYGEEGETVEFTVGLPEAATVDRH